MLRRCAARKSCDTSGCSVIRARTIRSRSNSPRHSGHSSRCWSSSFNPYNQSLKSVSFQCFISSSMAKVQVVQLLPKLCSGTKQMHFHGTNIQVQNLGDFRHAPVLMMPQCERRPLAETEFLKSAFQPPANFGSQDLI